MAVYLPSFISPSSIAIIKEIKEIKPVTVTQGTKPIARYKKSLFYRLITRDWGIPHYP
jgi:hypothetical protein